MIKKAVYIERAPAKINLFLNVLEKRADGYHDIETLFQAIDLADHITFEISVECADSEQIDFEIEIDSNAPQIRALGLNNSVTKAIETYFAEVPHEQIISLISKVHIEVFIDKLIPVEAGLAGGSANAAATLRALNKFFEENFNWCLNQKELIDISLKIGSDLPFALVSNDQPRLYAEGRGEKFSNKKIKFNFDKFNKLLVVKPSFGISTADAYKAYDIKGPVKTKVNINNGFYNSFEDVIFDNYPEILNIQEELTKLGCAHTLLSGSGSAMLGFLKSDANLEEIYNKAKGKFKEAKLYKAKFLNT